MRAKKVLVAGLRVIGTNIRLFAGKLIHGSKLVYSPKTALALSDNVLIASNACASFGRGMHTRGRCSFSVQESGTLIIGNDVFFNSGCQINCHKMVSIGDGCEFGPNVLVFDHDHNFRLPNGIKEKGFLYGNVQIGKRCWIGAGTIILRGTTIGDDCVIGASSVLKGDYPSGSLIIQKRATDIQPIHSLR